MIMHQKDAKEAMTTKVSVSKSQLARLAAIERRVAPLRKRLREHKLFQAFEDLEDVKAFMEIHVFAIWDFLALTKSLQRGPAEAAAGGEQRSVQGLVREMCARYDSDVNEEGEAMSHFDMYLAAMEQIGADTRYIKNFLGIMQASSDLKHMTKATNPEAPRVGGWASRGWDWQGGSVRQSVDSSLLAIGAPRGAQEFSSFTFSLVDSKQDHKIASSLAFGRQGLMMERLLAILDQAEAQGKEVGKFRYLLTRHIKLHNKNYTPLSFQILVETCGASDKMWSEAEQAAVRALEARLRLWDATRDFLIFKKPILEHEKSVNGGTRCGLKWQRVMKQLDSESRANMERERVLEGLRFSAHARHAKHVKTSRPSGAGASKGQARIVMVRRADSEALLKRTLPDVPAVAWKSLRPVRDKVVIVSGLGVASQARKRQRIVDPGHLSNLVEAKRKQILRTNNPFESLDN